MYFYGVLSEWCQDPVHKISFDPILTISSVLQDILYNQAACKSSVLHFRALESGHTFKVADYVGRFTSRETGEIFNARY